MNATKWIMPIVGVLVLASSQMAYATIELKLDDGLGHTVDLLDGAVGDTCAAANCVTFNGALGDWNINVDTGTSKDAAAPNLMDLSWNAHHNASTLASTLTISLSDNGFPGGGSLQTLVNGNQTAGGTFTSKLFDDGGNVKFALTTQCGATLSTSATVISGSQSCAAPATVFSLTEIVTATFGTAAGQTTGDVSIASVPEPATVSLLGGILLLSAGAIRRKMRRS